MEELVVLAAVIRAHMNAKGWSQEDLANRSGVAKATVSRILNASTSKGHYIPKAPTLNKLAMALDVPPGDLLSVIGVNSDRSQPAELMQRLARQLAEFPWLPLAVPRLTKLTPDELEEALNYVDFQREQRGRKKGQKN